MAIAAECPVCHRKLSAKRKACKCGVDLDKEKKAKKVKYHIIYRVNGKQKWESVSSFDDLDGYSIEDARTAEAKRKVQKTENRLMDVKPEARMTFEELSEWYLGLEKVKSMAYYPTLAFNLNSFNSEFDDMIVGQIKLTDLENYQAKRKKEEYSDSYIDQQVGAAKRMVNKAFFNDLVGGDTVKTFKRVEKLLKKDSNARDKILSLDQFRQLMEKLPSHAKAILATAFYTGMRKGEILKLVWDKVDMKERVIRLEATDTKDREAREIPIFDELYEILKTVPKAIHDNHVFLYKGRPIGDIRTSLTNACEEVGIPYGRKVKDGFVFHDLRHTFNTYMRKAGVHDSVIMEITGHSTTEMFHRYNTVDVEDRTQAVNQMGAYLQVLDKTLDNESQDKKKELANSANPLKLFGAEGETRTRTSVRTLDPEPSASTSSATSAHK